MSSGTQPSRALLIAAGSLTQLIGLVCLVLALASIPIAADAKTGMTGVVASVIASLAAIVCGTLVWRGRLVPLALAAGLDIGFGIGIPRGGSTFGAMLRILPADDAQTAEALIFAVAVTMFVAAILCVLAVPSALKLRHWARDEIARTGEYEVPTLASGPYAPSAGNTLRGLAPVKIMPTQVIDVGVPSRRKPAVIIGVAVTLIAIGIIVITAASSTKPDLAAGTGRGSGQVSSVNAGSATASAGGSAGSAAVPGDAALASADAAATPPDAAELVARWHAALESPERAELASLFDPAAFAIGADANDLAEGRDAVIAQLRGDLGDASVTIKFSHLGQAGDVAWLAEELRVGSRPFTVTAGLGLRDGAWTITALHVAQAMPNATAYRLARDGEIATPDAIPSTNDQTPLANAMRTAFASKPSFVDARSTRADAFNFGSAPGERLKGGEAIRKVFSRIAATIRLHDAVKVGPLGERGGWGVANVDFTDADRDGTEVTQTFRVLAIWVLEDQGWRIVLTQWSNAR